MGVVSRDPPETDASGRTVPGAAKVVPATFGAVRHRQGARNTPHRRAPGLPRGWGDLGGWRTVGDGL